MTKHKKTCVAYLIRAVLNTHSDFFVEKTVTQLVLKTQFYPSPIPLGTQQEETSLVFSSATKSNYPYILILLFSNLVFQVESNSYQKTICRKH